VTVTPLVETGVHRPDSERGLDNVGADEGDQLPDIGERRDAPRGERTRPDHCDRLADEG
jgi:hypothetical protein